MAFLPSTIQRSALRISGQPTQDGATTQVEGNGYYRSCRAFNVELVHLQGNNSVSHICEAVQKMCTARHLLDLIRAMDIQACFWHARTKCVNINNV